MSRPWHQALRFTFVSAFGVVPRALLRKVGIYSEQFVGWGHEDTELLARLLANYPLVNLFKRYCVFHQDHYVSPYHWVEHEQTMRVFKSKLKERHTRFDILAFAEQITSGHDIVPPSFAAKESVTSADWPKTAASLDLINLTLPRVLEEVASYGSILGVILTGSSTTTTHFNDLDLIAVLQYGERIMLRKVYQELPVPVDIEISPLDHIRHMENTHIYLPETWLLHIGRWAHGIILTDSGRILQETRARLVCPNVERSAFAITYTVGRMSLLLDKQKHKPIKSPFLVAEMSKCENTVRYLATASYPSGEQDLAADNDREYKTPESVWDRFINDVLTHFPAPPGGVKEILAKYPQNIVGAQIMASLRQEWKDCAIKESSL